MKTELICISVFLLTASAFCRKNDFLLSVENFTGFRNGEAIELLLEEDGDKYTKKSELVWTHDNNFYIGAKVSFGWKWFDTDIYGAAFIPKKSGKMFDSDWMGSNDVKTTFSVNENSLSAGSFFVGGNIGITVPLFTWFKASPKFSFECEYLAFEAKNGYGWYGHPPFSKTGKNVPWYSPDATYLKSGKLYGITYDRWSTFTWLGLYAFFTPVPQLEFSIGTSISPYIYIQSVDHHKNSGNGNYYYDKMRGNFHAEKLDLGIKLNINKMFGIKTFLTLTNVRPLEGETFSNSEGKYAKYYILDGYHSGTSAKYIDTGISFSYTPLFRIQKNMALD